MNLKSQLGQLRILAILEGISYLLFAITIPLKYKFDMLTPNYYVGMIHGGLFIFYCLWVVIVARQLKWNISRTLIALAASLVPIATFIVDHKILKPIQENDKINS